MLRLQGQQICCPVIGRQHICSPPSSSTTSSTSYLLLCFIASARTWPGLSRSRGPPRPAPPATAPHPPHRDGRISIIPPTATHRGGGLAQNPPHPRGGRTRKAGLRAVEALYSDRGGWYRIRFHMIHFERPRRSGGTGVISCRATGHVETDRSERFRLLSLTLRNKLDVDRDRPRGRGDHAGGRTPQGGGSSCSGTVGRSKALARWTFWYRT